VIGLGSGSTVVHVARRLGHTFRQLQEDAHHRRRHEDDILQGEIVCVPTSFQSKQLILEEGLALGDLERYPEVDIAIDGADEVDVRTLDCIKGGGGCQTQEKLVAYNAKMFVVVADHTKESGMLGAKWRKGIPVEVLPTAYVVVANALRRMGGNPLLRLCTGGKAGPIVTDNGNFVIDAHFGELPPARVRELDRDINMIPGVVEHGLFVGMAKRAYLGQEDGTVRVIVL
jgi:ribose 5-phosphate isomerase A